MEIVVEVFLELAPTAASVGEAFSAALWPLDVLWRQTVDQCPFFLQIWQVESRAGRLVRECEPFPQKKNMVIENVLQHSIE